MIKLNEAEKTSTIMTILSCLFISIGSYFEKDYRTYKNLSLSIIIILIGIIISIINIYICRKYDK